jgi:hypothetical protein
VGTGYNFAEGVKAKAGFTCAVMGQQCAWHTLPIESKVERLFSQMAVDVFSVSYSYDDHKEFFIQDLVNDAIVSRTDAV